ncbi:MAG: GspE/PulE family protein [Candidatus Cloacimonetes bacterium]|nr:GspE/PulE family protein [Candidatus Cloacimonadota bacterium]
MDNLQRFRRYLRTKTKFDSDIVDVAIAKMDEHGENTLGALAKALIEELGMDYDLVHGTIARYYAFSEIELNVDSLDINQVCRIKFLQEKIDQTLLASLFKAMIFPYKLIGEEQNTMQVLAADITSPLIHEIELQNPFKQIEINWTTARTIGILIEKSELPIEFCHIMRRSEQTIIDTQLIQDEQGTQDLEDEINKGFLSDLLDNVMVEAVRNDASDIHIIPSGKKAVDIYIRIDGRLKLWLRRENTPAEAVAAVVKDRSIGVDRFIVDKAQDGYMQMKIDNHLIRFRISILPMVSAENERKFESIVIRVIDDRKVISDFHKLGFLAQAETEFFKAINTNKGIVLVTGPTGSGKSTTLIAALKHVINPAFNVLTCEDPVEYVIGGARQLKIGHNMTFDEAMRGILRHDPDVVMVGEIRDKITADIAVKLANTGHLTLTSLHTNNASSAITRLYRMGVEPFLLAYSINIVIAQRLVRKLCEHCKKPISKEFYPSALSLGITQEELDFGKVFMPIGCSHCTDGYKGRICLVEALYFYPEIRAAIVESFTNIDEDKIRKLAIKNGMLTMKESGLETIRAGIASVPEVIYATSDD